MLRRLCAVLVLLPLWLMTAQAEAIEFRIAYEDKDTPAHTGAADVPADNPGITVEMLQLLPQRIPQLQIVFSRKPWARCLLELESGAADAVFASSFKPERLKLGVYPMKDGKDDRRYRIDIKSYSLYKRKGARFGWDGSRFSYIHNGIVAMRGYAIVDDLKKMGVEVTEVDKSESAFRMVLAGRVDGFAQLTEVGDYTLKKNPAFNSLVKVEPPIVVKDYYLQISHQFQAKHPELTQTIWQALADIRDAELERLTLKYMQLYPE